MSRITTRRTGIWIAVLIAALATVAAAITLGGMSSSQTDRARNSMEIADPAAVSSPVGGDDGVANIGELEDMAIAEESLDFDEFDRAAKAEGKTSSVAASGALTADVAAPASETLASVTLGQKVIQNGTMSLELDEDGLDGAMAEATSIAAAVGGYVSATDLADTGIARATVTLRIPAKHFAQVMKDLTELGEVQGRSMSGEDVTQEYVDTKSRMRHNRAVEKRLLALMDQATTIDETLRVQHELDAIQQQIEMDKGRLNYLDGMTETSTVTLTLRETGVPAGEDKPADDGLGVAAAFSEGLDAFMERINTFIVWLGGVLPALLVVGGVAIGGLIFWRRRRGTKSGAESHVAPSSVDADNGE